MPQAAHGGNIVLSWSDTTSLLHLVGVIRAVYAVLKVEIARKFTLAYMVNGIFYNWHFPTFLTLGSWAQLAATRKTLLLTMYRAHVSTFCS